MSNVRKKKTLCHVVHWSDVLAAPPNKLAWRRQKTRQRTATSPDEIERTSAVDDSGVVPTRVLVSSQTSDKRRTESSSTARRDIKAQPLARVTQACQRKQFVQAPGPPQGGNVLVKHQHHASALPGAATHVTRRHQRALPGTAAPSNGSRPQRRAR